MDSLVADPPVVLITGGSSGIGLACARLLVEQGWTVVVADADAAGVEAAAAELGPAHTAVVVDVTDEAQVRRLVEQTVEAHERLDAAVNSAGILGPRVELAETTLDDWRRVQQVNSDGLFLSLRAEIRAMLALEEPGSIVNVASIMGAVGAPLAGAYVASKHAVVGLTRATAWEYGERGIRVNAVGPGYTDTPMLADPMSQRREELAARHAFGRVATAHEIATAIGFLLSDQAAFITGAFLPVDGGFTAR